MEDPPIQQPPRVHSGDGPNPFAPTQSAELPSPRGRVNLPPAYWVVAGIAMVAFIVISFLFVGMGIPPIIALVFALVRVPLLQKRLSRIAPEKRQVAPIWMLLVSWCFMLIALFGSLLAFVVVCLPTSILTFSVSTGDESFIIVVGLSSFVALAAYGFLFYLSLKLPV